MKMYLRSRARRPYQPLDYSRPSTIADIMQAIVGAALFFAAIFAWYRLSQFLVTDERWRTWVLLGLFLLLLLAIDALARAQWGWDGVRMGLVVAGFALAGFLLVRRWLIADGSTFHLDHFLSGRVS